MKRRNSPLSIWMGAMGVLLVWSITGVAQDSIPATPASANAGVTEPASPDSGDTIKLSYGVADILKLARAKVSAETIIAFIGNSGRIYNLSANEILYLRNQGVDDRVLTAMLEQRKKLAEPVAWTTPPSRPAVETNPPQSTPAATAQTATAIVPSAPGKPMPPPVYLLRNPSPIYNYHDYYPYYRSPFPGISLSFGFGTSYYRAGGAYYHGPYR